MTPLYLRFPDRETALYIAEAMANVDTQPEPGQEHGWLTDFPPDGRLAGTYYVIQPVFGTGVVYSTAPSGQDADGNAVYTLREGFHINGLWDGDPDTIPAPLVSFMVAPVTPALVFG